MSYKLKSALFGAIVFTLAGCGTDIDASRNTLNSESFNKLRAEFVNPPNSSLPRTWFHAMSGNMSKAGITKDLESIKAVGIGGVLLFNVTQGIPVGPVKFNSDEHIDLIRHMAAESERLGLSFGVHNCDGWTSSGGPWITPENSMKKVVWSETQSRGGNINLVLAEPFKLENYYEDIATIAYPRLANENVSRENRPRISSSQANLDIDLITDGSVIGTSLLEASKDSPAFISFEYAEPFTLQSINFRFMNARQANILLLSSDDGVNFAPVKNLALRRPAKNDWGNDEALTEPITARYFRLQTDVSLDVQEVELSAVAKIGNFWGRSGSAKTAYSDLPPIGTVPDSSIIDSASVIDLSKNVDENGRLIAQLPEGDWTIMRFGQTSTGAKNLPASIEGLGLEVDKFSQPAVKIHYDAHMGKVVNAVEQVAPNAHQYTIIDSYEVGAQNWTTGYDALFKNEKGYDLIPFLPLLAGRFVDSAEVSERVTWDMRAFSNDLMAENYFGYFTELAKADGLDVYIESYGDGPFNELDAGGKADVPMGEFWVNRFGNRVNVAVSSAALYGKPVASAEAFTDIWDDNWKMHPASVKTIGDANWALGVNEFMFHRFAHQANTHVKPGMTMNRWGSHFDRTQTWWDTAGKDWFEYLGRGQHLLRQGIPVNDALLFVGDGAPSLCPDREKTDIIPVSLSFICLNADVLQTRLSVGEGGFNLPEGGEHKFIVLDNSDSMTRETLNALDTLSESNGGIIIGQPPQHLAGFVQTPEEREAFDTKVVDIWSRENVLTFNVVASVGWDAFLSSINHRVDLAIDGKPEALFTHRKIDNKDVYFLYNAETERQDIKARFRVKDKAVSLWSPMDGSVAGVKSYSHEADHTIVNFFLAPQESVFVVFDGDRPLTDSTLEKPFREVSELPVLSPWTVRFDSEYGSNKIIALTELTDLKDHSDNDVRHYSGPATYETQVNISDNFLSSGERFVLNLGDVQIAATVKINGAEQGTSWLPPHRIDVTNALKTGKNSISISVVNLWVNRLIGDAALPDLDGYTQAVWSPPRKFSTPQMPDWYSNNEPPVLGERVTFTTVDFYDADDALLPSGLMGPVTITKFTR
ncbi:glycosyl hydrolase [Fretibacter rubidus]|uniref:glycosyl hydrolase n=1 Tax=Fretibacter rubidus TaxID=570162 RepID=UPI00352A55E1